MKIYARNGEDARSLMRKLKRFLEKEGTIKEMRRHEFYEKPSERKRRKKLRSKVNVQRSQMERPSGQSQEMGNG